VPCCHDRDVSRRRDHVESSVVLDWAAGDAVLVGTLVAQITWWLIVIHLVEIALWALFFWWQKCLPDAESSFYFSGVTYATIGFADLVLPKEWRLLGP
jgi:Ion channel